MKISFRENLKVSEYTSVYDNQSRTKDNFPKVNVLENLVPDKKKPSIKLFLDKERAETKESITMGLNSRNQLSTNK